MCEKVLQMLLSLQVPANQVIAGINSFIEEKNLVRSRKKGKMMMKNKQREEGELESSLCQFIYAYLMHDISFIQIKAGVGDDELNEGKIGLYKEILVFIDSLKYSRHPNTTCWLIEILHILSNKFIAPQSMSRSSIQRQLEQQLNLLLETAASIINNDSEL